MRILLAEDDGFLAGGILFALRQSGYAVDHAKNGREADQSLKMVDYDLLVLDLGLPVIDGMEVLKALRGRDQRLPVLILTARDTLADRVLGLDSGANDYLTKPFELPELEARIRALLRKTNWDNRTQISFGPLTFDTSTKECFIDQEKLELSGRDMALLEALLEGGGRVVRKKRLSELLSSWDTELSFNGIEIAVHRLRKKLEPTGTTIRTVRGVGYAIEETKA